MSARTTFNFKSRAKPRPLPFDLALCPLPFDLTSYKYLSHHAGFRCLTLENHNDIGISIASTVAQHR